MRGSPVVWQFLAGPLGVPITGAFKPGQALLSAASNLQHTDSVNETLHAGLGLRGQRQLATAPVIRSGRSSQLDAPNAGLLLLAQHASVKPLGRVPACCDRFASVGLLTARLFQSSSAALAGMGKDKAAYAVIAGKEVGVLESVQAVANSINKISRAQYKGFDTRKAAEAFSKKNQNSCMIFDQHGRVIDAPHDVKLGLCMKPSLRPLADLKAAHRVVVKGHQSAGPPPTMGFGVLVLREGTMDKVAAEAQCVPVPPDASINSLVYREYMGALAGLQVAQRLGLKKVTLQVGHKDVAGHLGNSSGGRAPKKPELKAVHDRVVQAIVQGKAHFDTLTVTKAEDNKDKELLQEAQDLGSAALQVAAAVEEWCKEWRKGGRDVAAACADMAEEIKHATCTPDMSDVHVAEYYRRAGLLMRFLLATPLEMANARKSLRGLFDEGSCEHATLLSLLVQQLQERSEAEERAAAELGQVAGSSSSSSSSSSDDSSSSSSDSEDCCTSSDEDEGDGECAVGGPAKQAGSAADKAASAAAAVAVAAEEGSTGGKGKGMQEHKEIGSTPAAPAAAANHSKKEMPSAGSGSAGAQTQAAGEKPKQEGGFWNGAR